MAGDTENVRVAVRVRPFNNRERQRNAKCIIEMQNKTTVLFNPNDLKEKPKKFTFDHSYWSNDGFKLLNDQIAVPDPSHANGQKFADQARIYEEIGKPILENAFSGYNASLFAYGQTGSGKSYTVVGYGKNKGIVPRICEDLFTRIKSKKESGDKTVFEIRFSMMEIYNEVVRDLCNPKELRNKKGLKVREHPNKGFYAEGLKSFLVTNQQEIEQKIEEGTTNRSIAATNMNETSSRAHTIVIIQIIQKVLNKQNEETTKSSTINIVDLAGSERLSGTNSSSGDRLKEGVSINLSLSCLGNCIHALAEKSNGKNIRVPFRDSVLTRLLMNALGGNSKTIMIATISPADINYEETFSTLRYADRAKQIKTHAVINENATNKVLKQLREENDRLKKMMESGMVVSQDQMSSKDLNEMKKKWEDDMQAAMKENELKMERLKQSYEEKLQEKQAEEMRNGGKGGQLLSMKLSKEIEQAKKKNPYLYNLNFDEQLSGRIVHIIQNGTNTLGKSNDCNIHLYGPSIQEVHARLIRKGNNVLLEKANDNCRILLNGDLVKTKINLNHNDRLLFGTTQLFVFAHPTQENKNSLGFSEISFELAQEEIALKAGFELNNSEDQSFEIALLNKDLLEVLPGIELANAISEELNKNVRFEIMLVSPQFLGKISHLNAAAASQSTERTEVFIKVYDLMNNLEFEWSKEKFLNRLYIMKEMYQNYEQGSENSDGSPWNLPKEKDPFYEDINQEQLIGTSQLYLQPLSFNVESNEQIEILDYRGNEIGFLNVELQPCDEKGREYSELDDNFVDSPFELIGKPLHFKLKINSCRGLSSRFTNIYVKYKMFLDPEFHQTSTSTNTSNPDWDYTKMFSFNPVTRQLVDYLKDGFVVLLIYGKQIAKPNHSLNNSYPTRLSRQKAGSDDESGSTISNSNNLPDSSGDKQGLVLELMNIRRQKVKLQQRIDNIRMLIEVCDEQRKHFVSVKLVKDLLSITTQELAENMIMKSMNPNSTHHHGHHLNGASEIANNNDLYQPSHQYDLDGLESRSSTRKQSHSATCSIS